jgi:hypothetical protein
MLTFETYSLILIFYASIGVSQGAAYSWVETDRHERKAYSGIYLLSGMIGLVYAVLGLVVLKFGSALYAYIPVLLLWWGGKLFGRMLYFPDTDSRTAAVVVSFPLVSVLLYHFAL